MHPKGARRSPSLQAYLGLLPYRRTLGGHRRFPEAAIRELAASLHQEVQG